MQYRADIDGIRALAVSLVLVFHAGFSFFPGGFIGVDVFFVISGYLITDNLLQSMKSGTFSILNFYDRRVRRILPAFLVLIAATLVAGFLILTPGAYAVLGRSAAFAALGLSNFFFFRNTGYFDGAAEAMPLLHTWSLAVEEQFYLAWPLVLYAAYRGSRRWPRLLVVVIALAVGLSFALAVQKVAEGAKSAFYLPLGRAWELAIGGALVLARDRLSAIPGALAQALKLAGLALILVPALLLGPTSSFPGLNALAPVLGAALLILPTRAPTFGARLLALAPLPFIGRISYSLYLWHWPIIVFARQYKNGDPLTTGEAVAALAASVLAAWLSWRFVEQPFRARRFKERTVVLAGSAACLLVAALSFGIYRADGISGRVSAQLEDLGSLTRMWGWECPQHVSLDGGPRLCVAGADWASAKTRGIIWGDSHAEHLMHLLDVAGRKTDTAVALLRICPAIFSTDGLRRKPVGLPPECERTYRATLAMLAANPQINLVILASAWGFMPDAVYRREGDPTSLDTGLKLMRDTFLDLAPRLAAPGRRIVLFADIPHWASDPLPCVAANDGSLLRAPCRRDVARLSPAEFGADQRAVNAMFRSLRGVRKDMEVAIPADRLCDETGCMARFDGEFLYFDRDHFRRNIPMATRARFADLLGLPGLIDVAGAPAEAAGGIGH
ncbi:acyltransferase family protein [Xanthobacter sp. DSM 24535]|uniref:acyltransferase family protein n=1 Tax=Roseixanthobacter psychrophilus TaxID=3119917 RepID=UPI00372CC2B6